MLLSSCVIWRYRSLEAFQEECPTGDPALQRVIVDRLDEAIEWLESLGAPVVEHETGNPRTVGKRFDPAGLTQTLVRVIGDDSVRLSERGQALLQEADILSTGGFAARLARERGFRSARIRGARGTGSTSRSRAAGAPPATSASSTGGRCRPASTSAEQDFVRLSQLYGRFAEVTSEDGRERFDGDPGWSETALVQAIARWPGGRLGIASTRTSSEERVRERTVGEMIEAAREAGATVRDEPPFTSVLVQASVTQTLGGLRIDERARVVGVDGLLRGGRRRRGHLRRRLLERARRSARLRPRRRGDRAQLVVGRR